MIHSTSTSASLIFIQMTQSVQPISRATYQTSSNNFLTRFWQGHKPIFFQSIHYPLTKTVTTLTIPSYSIHQITVWHQVSIHLRGYYLINFVLHLHFVHLVYKKKGMNIQSCYKWIQMYETISQVSQDTNRRQRKSICEDLHVTSNFICCYILEEN